MKVLIVAGKMHVGGIENQLMHLARNVDRDKYQIDFTSTMPEAIYREEIEELGGKFHIIPEMNWKNPIPYCVSLYKIMKNEKYDIVHSHELFHSGITLLIAFFAGVPCRFVHAHNWSDDDGTGRKRSFMRSVYNRIMQFMINRFSTVQIACSSWAGRFLYGKKIQQEASYHLVFNSVDTSKFLDKYEDIETGEFCEDGWINILNVGRITAVKNQLFLVDIAEEFRRRGEKIRILCAGNGDEDYIEAVKKQIKERKLEEYIQLLGVRRDIDVLMRKSKAFVLPSKYEGMPLVIIEAQSSGLVCVSANTYSPEVDFEIGTMLWIPLDAGTVVWADTLKKAVENGRAKKADVEYAVMNKRFDSKMFAQTLCELYKVDYELRGV